MDNSTSNLPQRVFNGNDLPGINTGQKALFLLVCKCLKQKRIANYEELKHIYITEVQQSEYTGDNYWNEENGKWDWKSRKKDEWEVEICYQSWLLRALGALIKKGYLMVIPRIEFSNAKRIEELKNETHT